MKPRVFLILAGLALAFLVGCRSSPSPERAEPFADPSDPALLFATDVRNDAFADRREAFLRRLGTAALARHAPGAEIVELEFRTETCRIVVDVPDDGWSARMAQWIPWGLSKSTMRTRSQVEIFASTSRETLGHDDFERLVSRWLRPSDLNYRVLRAGTSPQRR